MTTTCRGEREEMGGKKEKSLNSQDIKNFSLKKMRIFLYMILDNNKIY